MLTKAKNAERAHPPNPYPLSLGLLTHPDRQLSGIGDAGRSVKKIMRAFALLTLVLLLGGCMKRDLDENQLRELLNGVSPAQLTKLNYSFMLIYNHPIKTP